MKFTRLQWNAIEQDYDVHSNLQRREVQMCLHLIYPAMVYSARHAFTLTGMQFFFSCQQFNRCSSANGGIHFT